MLKLLGFLFTGCFHKWKTIDKHKVEYRTDFSSGVHDRYVLQCEKCGNIKKKDTK